MDASKNRICKEAYTISPMIRKQNVKHSYIFQKNHCLRTFCNEVVFGNQLRKHEFDNYEICNDMSVKGNNRDH